MSPDKRAVVLAMLADGHFVTTACKKAGISREHYYETRRNDAAFGAATDAAIADSEAACLAAIKVDPQWQSKAWILERRFAERWAKKPEAALTGQPTATTITLPDSPAERAAVLRALADKAEGGT